MLTRVLILLLILSAVAAFLMYGPEGMVGGWLAILMSVGKTAFYWVLELGQTVLAWLQVAFQRLMRGA